MNTKINTKIDTKQIKPQLNKGIIISMRFL